MLDTKCRSGPSGGERGPPGWQSDGDDGTFVWGRQAAASSFSLSAFAFACPTPTQIKILYLLITLSRKDKIGHFLRWHAYRYHVVAFYFILFLSKVHIFCFCSKWSQAKGFLDLGRRKEKEGPMGVVMGTEVELYNLCLDIHILWRRLEGSCLCRRKESWEIRRDKEPLLRLLALWGARIQETAMSLLRSRAVRASVSCGDVSSRSNCKDTSNKFIIFC
jgi:hypothetical protein